MRIQSNTRVPSDPKLHQCAFKVQCSECITKNALKHTKPVLLKTRGGYVPKSSKGYKSSRPRAGLLLLVDHGCLHKAVAHLRVLGSGFGIHFSECMLPLRTRRIWGPRHGTGIYLRFNVRNGRGSMRNNHGSLSRSSKLLEDVEVLGDHHHVDHLGGGSKLGLETLGSGP
jgi:hypothetical protein